MGGSALSSTFDKRVSYVCVCLDRIHFHITSNIHNSKRDTINSTLLIKIY